MHAGRDSNVAVGAAHWPRGHIGWAFTGMPEFEGRAASFLAEGVARRERLMFVADDPDVGLWPKGLIGQGALLVVSTAEIYGTETIVDACTQRVAFEAALAEAISLGFTGLRVVADNTSLVAGPDRLAAWMRWEAEAGHMMQGKPITGLCAFDRTRTDAETLRVVMSLHPVGPPQRYKGKHAGSPTPMH